MAQSRHRRDSPGGVPQWVLITIMFLITAAWITNFLISVFNPHYQPPGQINTAFITIVGAILVNAAARYKGSTNGNGNNDSDDDHDEEDRPRPLPRSHNQDEEDR